MRFRQGIRLIAGASITCAMLVTAGCAASGNEQSKASTTLRPVTESAPASSTAPTTTRVPPPGGVVVGRVGKSVDLTLMDPLTGKESQFKSFPYDDASYIIKLSRDANVGKTLFSPDFSKMAYTQKSSDGSSHAGWLDTRGSFTDVSAANGAGSGFASIRNASEPRFDSAGNFFYVDNEGQGTRTEVAMMVRAGSLSPAVKVAERELATPAEVDVQLDDGSYYDASSNPSKLSRCDAAGQCTSLVPTTNLLVTNAVLNPAQDELLFLSPSAALASTAPIRVFTVPAQGGQPEELSGADLGPSLALSPVALLAWI